MPRLEILAAIALVPLLGACATTVVPNAPGGSAAVGGSHREPVRPPSKMAPRTAQVHMAPGLEDVIGATQSELTRRFGDPRLDVWEGDARKLQFTGSACVLDVYLYPATRGAAPQATYVDSRRASDGQDVDRASCVAALRKPAVP